MKKILTTTAVVAAVAALSGALVACGETGGKGKTDKQKATEAISYVNGLYGQQAETIDSKSYNLIGVAYDEDNNPYNIKWTVSSDFANFAEYVQVGDMNDKKSVPVTIKKATEEISYTLTATVNVGKASASADYKRKIEKGVAVGEDEQDASIDFTGTTNRTEFTDEKMVWTQNGITLTNTKGTNGTAITAGDSNYHARIYAGTHVKIEYPSMSKIVFHSDKDQSSTSYHENLKTVLTAAKKGEFTADDENRTVTLTLASPADELEFDAPKQLRFTQIEIVAKKAALTDEQKVDAAQAALDLTTKNYSAVGTYDLPTTQSGVAVTWAVKGTSANVAIEGGKLKVNSLPAEGAEAVSVTLTATLKLNDVTKTKDITIKLVNLGLVNDGTLAKPYTPSEAVKATKLLGEGSTGTEDVYVQGYVIKCEPYKQGETVKSYEIYIADEYVEGKDTTGDDVFLCYGVQLGTYLTAEAGLANGDLATFKGKLQYYKKGETLTPELTLGGECVAVTAGADLSKTDKEKVEAAQANVKLNATYNAGATVTLPTTQNGASLSWTVKSGAGVTISGNTMTIGKTATGEVTLTVSITSGDETATKDISFTVVTVNYGTVAAPISVTQALAITAEECKLNGNVTAEVVTMTGIVADVPEYNATYKSYTYHIKDLTDSSKTITVYSQHNVRDGVAEPAQNDTVVISGYIKNYSGIIEFTSNKPAGADKSVYVYVESNTRGNSTITLGDHEGATVTGLPTAATENGTEVSFTVTVADGKEIKAVKVYGMALTATEGTTYKFTVAGNATVTVETKNEGEVDPIQLTLSFADKAQRTTQTSEKQVWEQNGIVFTNEKASSSSNVADYANPVRCYSKSSIKVEHTDMTKIVFHCNSNAYATDLSKSIGTMSGVTVIVDGKDVTVVFSSAQSEFTISSLSAKIFIDSIDVY